MTMKLRMMREMRELYEPSEEPDFYLGLSLMLPGTRRLSRREFLTMYCIDKYGIPNFNDFTVKLYSEYVEGKILYLDKKYEK